MERWISSFRNTAAAITLATLGMSIMPSAQATGVPNNPPPCDRVTGGGFIYTSSGAKATFAVNFGRNAKGELFVQVNFIDHGVGGPRIKATAATAYKRVGTDPGKRRLEGIATNKAGDLFTFVVVVDDNGEPGTADTFRITLENGYTAGGTLAGGNIQFHNQCRPSGGPNR